MLNTESIRKKCTVNLYVALTLMILGYFTLSENVAITQGLKIVFRMGMTGLVMYTLQRMQQISVSSFRYDNLLAFGLYLLYLLLGLASFCWSTKISYSSLQWIMAAESVVFCIYFVKCVVQLNVFFPQKPLHFHTLFGVAIMLIMIGFLIGAIFAPDQFFRATRGGEESRFGGYLMNPNELGMLSSMGSAMGVMEFTTRKNKVLPIAIILLCLTSLVLTSSRSSTIGFFLIAYILLKKFATPRIKLMAGIGGAAVMPFVLNAIILKAGDIDEVLSMTGRLPFWTALLNEGIVREPFFGFGFMRINYTDAFQSVHTYAGQMTHNTFMQVLMNLGFVGMFIVVLQVAATIRAFRRAEAAHKNLFFAIYIPVLINSFTEFGIFGEANYSILFYQFLLCFFMIHYHPEFTLMQRVQLKKLGVLERILAETSKPKTDFPMVGKNKRAVV